MMNEEEIRKLLQDPEAVIEIGDHEPPRTLGPWAHVCLLGCGLSAKDRERDKDRAKKRAREREARLRAQQAKV
jgi:hypothetical protein